MFFPQILFVLLPVVFLSKQQWLFGVVAWVLVFFYAKRLSFVNFDGKGVFRINVASATGFAMGGSLFLGDGYFSLVVLVGIIVLSWTLYPTERAWKASKRIDSLTE